MDALLLLGPTGVGKTPLGDLLQARGLHGRRCLHFDFGACLRRASREPASAPRLDAAAQAVIRRVLDAGTLLADDEFPIAATLLQHFLSVHAASARDWLVLNGLPRHRGQARAIDAAHRVRTLIHLDASPEVVHERIRLDAGGDRRERVDDAPAQVRARLASYQRRSAALLAHYADLGATRCSLQVGVATTAEDALRDLEPRLPSGAAQAP